MLYMLWQTHKRSSFRRIPAEMGIVSCLEFIASNWNADATFYRGVWRWGLGPAVPGSVLLMVGLARINPVHARQWGWTLLGVNTVVVLMCLYGWIQREGRAHKLQAQIDERDV